jgi:sugar phosphate isomerase/epimerase
MMYMGISTACLYPMETEKALARLIGLGFRRFELFVNCESECTGRFAREVLQLLEGCGGRVYSVHLFTGSFEPFLFFTDYERRIADAVRQFRRYFRFARQVGAEMTVFHGALRGYSIPIEKYCERFLRLGAAAQEERMLLAQENVSRCTSATVDAVRAMRACSGGRMKFILDTKQALRAGQPVREMLRAMGSDLVNVHLSDRRPEEDCLLPGRGEEDLPGLCAALAAQGYGGPLTIEVYRQNFKTAEELRRAGDYVDSLIST